MVKDSDSDSNLEKSPFISLNGTCLLCYGYKIMKWEPGDEAVWTCIGIDTFAGVRGLDQLGSKLRS